MIKNKYRCTYLDPFSLSFTTTEINKHRTMDVPRMDVMLDFICMGPVDLEGARRNMNILIIHILFLQMTVNTCICCEI